MTLWILFNVRIKLISDKNFKVVVGLLFWKNIKIGRESWSYERYFDPPII